MNLESQYSSTVFLSSECGNDIIQAPWQELQFSTQPTTLIYLEADHGTVLEFGIKCSGKYIIPAVPVKPSYLYYYNSPSHAKLILYNNNYTFPYQRYHSASSYLIRSRTPQSTPQTYLRLPAIDPRAIPVFHRVLSLTFRYQSIL